MRLSESSKLKGDAAIGLLSTGALSVGVMVVSMTTGMTVDICNYMFGSILVLSTADMRLGVLLCIAVLVLYALCYNKIFAVTFDEAYAKATGTNANFYNTLLAVLTAITIALGMRLMGALLISSLIIFPALTAMRVFKSFKAVVLCAAVLSVFCFLAGIVISYLYATPAGASVVTVNMAAFFIFWAAGLLQSKGKI